MSPDLKEFLQLLRSHRVEYLLVGGFAVAAHGYPRYTKDIDIWFHQTPENAARLLTLLDEFGFGALGLTEADFLEDDVVIQLGRPPNRIDLLASPSGVLFEDCYPRRSQALLEGVEVDLINLEDLKRNKMASGRAQDLADLDNLSEPRDP